MKLFLASRYLLIFLSLTSTPPATTKYAKTGCNGKCGTVRIPYPFGIGAECSVYKWYVVDCNSTPYLPAVNNLEVLGVDFENQIVTISMPKISHCRNPILNSSQTKSLDLGRSPFFFFSKSHNKFVFEGCGNAAMIADNGSVVTGCSTGCLNVTVSDRNNCFGNGCCQTAIPHYLKSYSINLTVLERQGEDGGCGSAFLAQKTSYDHQGRFPEQFIVWKNTSIIPLSLLWTLTDTDHVTCCDSHPPEKRKVVMFNGTTVDTFVCNIHYTPSPEGSPYLIDGCKLNEENVKYAKTGCNDMCGNVRIPFPFGIGEGCSVNQWYIVNCISATPYLPVLNHLQVLGISLKDQLVNVSTPSISYCQNVAHNGSEIMGIDLGSSPFWFSNRRNIFVFEGCGTAALMADNGSVLTACSTACRGATLSDRYDCFGIGRCCNNAIPNFIKSYNVQFTEEDGGCGSAFLVDKTSYDQERINFDPFISKNTFSTRVSLVWTLRESDQVTCCHELPQERITMDMFNGTTVDTWNCYMYSEGTGNPYLVDGCKLGREKTIGGEECRRCKDRGGYCSSRNTYDVDGLVFSENFICLGDGRISLGVILGVSISTGILFLVAASYLLYKVIKKTKERRQRKRFFKCNGGLLLKQQEEADPSLVDKTIHFTSRELQNATDNFNENRILGRGGQGTVYKGMLVDGRIVAVKK